MAKLTRVDQKIFGENGATGQFGVVGSEAAGSPTTSKDLETIQSLSQFGNGLYSITANAGEPPRIEEINSIYYLVTSQLKYIFQNGFPEWHEDTDYFANVSFCQLNGVIYISRTGTDGTPNTGNNPSSSPTDWKVFMISDELQIKRNTERRAPVGTIYQVMGELTPSAWDPDNPLDYEPIVDLESAGTYDEDDMPDFVPWLRAQKVWVWDDLDKDTGIKIDEFPGVAAGSVITLNNTVENVEFIGALIEDYLFFGVYNRPVTWDNTDYTITDVNGVTREITVTGTPTAGAGSATFHPYRIVGSTTTARILAHDGLVLATGGASGRVTGLVTRDRMQGFAIQGYMNNQGDASIFNSIGPRGAASEKYLPVGDTVNGYGTPRTGSTTRDRSLSVRFYAHVGRYE